MLVDKLSTSLGRIRNNPTAWTVVAIFLSFFIWSAWFALHIKSELSSTQSAPPPKPPSIAKPSIDYSAIGSSALFGQPVSSNASTSAVATDLALTLRAVFASADQAAGAAIIEASGQPPRYIKIGEAVPGGALLHEVLKDHVVLKRDERLETLGFPQPGVSSPQSVAAADTSPAAPPAPSEQAPAEAPSDYSALAAYVGGESTADTIRKRLEELRRRAQEARAQRQANPQQGE